jgi:DUF1009 family protein
MSWFDRGSAPLGLIAGEGEFPILFAKAASALNKPVILIGLSGHTDRRVEAFVKEAHYISLGALADLIDVLKKTRVRNVVLAGAVPKKEMYNTSGLDSTAQEFMVKGKNKGDDHLLKAFSLFLKARCGVSVVDSRSFLKDSLAKKGVLTKRAPSETEWKDIRFGRSIVKGIGKLDIGQTIVVKNGVVLAVEAIEGTDQAIRRGGQLANGGAVVVKMSKPNQDLRFDLPCVGLETLESLKSVQSRVLAVESKKTLMLNASQIIERADAENITVVGI